MQDELEGLLKISTWSNKNNQKMITAIEFLKINLCIIWSKEGQGMGLFFQKNAILER
jgi:hypothetical protein